jgi:hypothetical protein
MFLVAVPFSLIMFGEHVTPSVLAVARTPKR